MIRKSLLMKRYLFSSIFLALFVPLTILAQVWNTTGGNTARNGMGGTDGPDALTGAAWTVTDATPSLWGNAIFTSNGRFATSRVSFSPVYHVTVECRDLYSGSLLWNKDFGGEAKLYVVGMTDDAVYVHNYAVDSLYSFNPSDGSINWVCPEKAMIFGGAHGILFACNGDPVVNGPELYQKSLMRLDRFTGEVLWYNQNLVSVGPAPDFCVVGDKLYKWEGAIGAPMHLVAVDLNTGDNLYYSEEIGGEALQEIPLTAGPDGTIYGQRDGGDLWAITDNGDSFSVKWFYSPENGGMGTYGNVGIGPDGSVYFADGTVVKRLDPADGSVMNTSEALSSASMWGTYITTDPNGIVYISNSEAEEGAYFAFTPDLQKIWEMPVPYNYYAGPQLNFNGLFITAGSGTTINAYASGILEHAPAAWFTSDKTYLTAGGSVAFTDQSSFFPTSWHWYFEGGNPQESTEQNPVISYDEPGIFPVKLTVSNWVGYDTLFRECYITIDEPSWVSKTNFAKYSVFPNPSDGRFTIISNEDLAGCSMGLFDLSGQQIFSLKLSGSSNYIDVRNILSGGIYIGRISGNRQIASFKLIIQ